MKDREFINRENMEQQQAFDYYYSLGDNRTIAQAARELGYRTSTLKKWSTEFSWQRRVVERDHHLGMELQKRTNRQILKDQIEYRNILRKSIYKYEQNLEDNKVDIKTVKDLVSLIECDLKLMGILSRDPEEQKKQQEKLSEETNKTIKTIMSELNNIEEPEDEDLEDTEELENQEDGDNNA